MGCGVVYFCNDFEYRVIGDGTMETKQLMRFMYQNRTREKGKYQNLDVSKEDIWRY